MTPLCKLQSELLRNGIHGLEIEVRLGKKRGSAFVPGVTREHAQRICETLDKSSSFRALVPAQTVDYAFRGHTGRLQMPQGLWVEKEKFLNDDAEGYRLSCAYEHVKPRPPATEPGQSASYRKKQRKSYEWQEGGWRVDVTSVESNADPDAEDAAWEVEAEFVRTTDVFFKPLWVILQTGELLARDLCAM